MLGSSRRGQRACVAAGGDRRPHRPARRRRQADAERSSRYRDAVRRLTCSAVLDGDTALTELMTCGAHRPSQVHSHVRNTRFTIRSYALWPMNLSSRADRATLHRRLAEAIVRRDPGSADENAALIAEHLEAAGDLAPAHEWHMRAGTWLTNRDLAAAHASWYRAQQVADQLPADHPGRMAMRIAPRTLLTGGGWRVRGSGAEVAFDELRELCELAGDKRSLAIGMTGLVMKHALNSEHEKASRSRLRANYAARIHR